MPWFVSVLAVLTLGRETIISVCQNTDETTSNLLNGPVQVSQWDTEHTDKGENPNPELTVGISW